MKASLVLVQQESISVSIIRGTDSRTAFFLEGKILECSLLSCFACLLFHSQSSPGLCFSHSCIFTDSRFASRPTIRQFSTLIAYGLHRGAAEQRSVELLLAQHVTQSSVKLPSRSGGLGRLKWAELRSKAGTKPNVPTLHILILLRSMHCFLKKKAFIQKQVPFRRRNQRTGFTLMEVLRTWNINLDCYCCYSRIPTYANSLSQALPVVFNTNFDQSVL